MFQTFINFIKESFPVIWDILAALFKAIIDFFLGLSVFLVGGIIEIIFELMGNPGANIQESFYDVFITVNWFFPLVELIGLFIPILSFFFAMFGWKMTVKIILGLIP